ncbi:O-antigen ligase family protein [Deinococcus aerolatus]|uniref:O-antigen ligase family protein n=1 Tax=Deinococcus aerolatus TaxID=522487 RepID=UPI00166BE4CE|nr:O-antigen ligase family protein [Deinococcus aerolatus]
MGLTVAAALAAPQPAAALLGALFKLSLILGLTFLGAKWVSSASLRGLLPGILLVLATAQIYAAQIGAYQLLVDRLSHPYYTSVSLGLGGAVAVWVAVLSRSLFWPWRVVGILAGGALLGLSGSRGGVLALLAGLLAAGLVWLVRTRRFQTVLWSAAVGVLLLGGFALLHIGSAGGETIPVLDRLSSLEANGRDVTWSDTLDAIAAYPFSGYGPYQLGPQIAPVTEKCVWWPALQAARVECPALVQHLDNVWVIAHNAVLQVWGESGLPGLLGHLLLCALLVIRTWRSGDPLANAILLGLFAADLTDNVTMVPGPFFAALPWLVGGMGLRGNLVTPAADSALPSARTWFALPWVATALLIFWGFPLWAATLETFRPSAAPEVTIREVVASPVWRGDDPYQILLMASAPAGPYRLQARLCAPDGSRCHTVMTRNVQSEGIPPTLLQILRFPLKDSGPWEVQLQVRHFAPRPWQLRALALTSWPLRRDDRP